MALSALLLGILPLLPAAEVTALATLLTAMSVILALLDGLVSRLGHQRIYSTTLRPEELSGACTGHQVARFAEHMHIGVSRRVSLAQ